MTKIVIRMGGLSRQLRINQSVTNVQEWEMTMAGYIPHLIKADGIPEAVATAMMNLSSMRRDPQAAARASARMKKIHEARKEHGGAQPAKNQPVATKK